MANKIILFPTMWKVFSLLTKDQNSLNTSKIKLSLMVFCFFKKLIQPLMMKLSGKMILKVKSFTRTVNLTYAVFWFNSKKMFWFHSKRFFIRKKLSDNDGRILILHIDIDDKNFILINLYNPNTEAEQLKTLSKLTEMLTKLHLSQNNNIICTGWWLQLVINIKLESYGGNPVFKKRSVGKVF